MSVDVRPRSGAQHEAGGTDRSCFFCGSDWFMVRPAAGPRPIAVRRDRQERTYSQPVSAILSFREKSIMDGREHLQRLVATREDVDRFLGRVATQGQASLVPLATFLVARGPAPSRRRHPTLIRPTSPPTRPTYPCPQRNGLRGKSRRVMAAPAAQYPAG